MQISVTHYVITDSERGNVNKHSSSADIFN